MDSKILKPSAMSPLREKPPSISLLLVVLHCIEKKHLLQNHVSSSAAEKTDFLYLLLLHCCYDHTETNELRQYFNM